MNMLNTCLLLQMYGIHVFRHVDSKLITASSESKSKIVSFDVTSVIERLSKEEKFKRNYGIIVQSMTDSGKRTRIIELFDFESINVPVLIIYTYNNGSGTIMYYYMYYNHVRIHD